MKRSIIFSILLIAAVSYLYFSPGGAGRNMGQEELFEEMEVKSAMLDGEVKLFASAKNNTLRMMGTAQGNPIPEHHSMVIGYAEAEMMREEKLFEQTGDPLTGFFGIDTKVEGILKRTNSMADDMHFLSRTQLRDIKGNSNVFIKFNGDMAKFFITSDRKPGYGLVEGSWDAYKIQNFGGRLYYPIVLGYDEAMEMKMEGLFTVSGDRIEDFFGKRVFIAGILQKRGNAADMLHFTTLSKGEWE